jgi:hypothetical protein
MMPAAAADASSSISFSHRDLDISVHLASSANHFLSISVIYHFFLSSTFFVQSSRGKNPTALRRPGRNKKTRTFNKEFRGDKRCLGPSG